MKCKRDLEIRVDISSDEVSSCFKRAIKTVRHLGFEYYKIYLKHLVGLNVDVDSIMRKLSRLKESIEYRISCTDYCDERLAKNLLDSNQYFSKSTRRPGVIVKLFKTQYNRGTAIVKTYVYDPKCASLKDRVESNFVDEALFQLYAGSLNKTLDFISPELYSWGKLRAYIYPGDNYVYKCMFLIMEYIPNITLDRAMFTTENIKKIYQKVGEVDKKLSGHMLHHNDLHGGNIMVRSPFPEIVILDFGEAGFGTTKPLFL